MNRIERIVQTRTELLAQPEVLRKTLQEDQETPTRIVRQCVQRDFQRVYLIGCGDSFSVAEAVASLWQHWLRMPVQAIQALELAYVDVDDRTLLVAISAMGRAGTTLDATCRGQGAGAFVLVVTNAPSSDLARLAAAVLPIPATRNGWPTQSTTAPISALLSLGLLWADLRSPSAERDALRTSLQQLPDVVAQVLQTQDTPMRALAERWIRQGAFFFAGSGPAYTAARLGASKVKEVSQDHAYAMYLEEYHHFYSVKKGEAFFLLAPPGPSRPRAVDTAQSAHNVWADVVILQDASDDAIYADCPRIDLPSVPLELASIVYALPLQLFTQHLGVLKQQPEWALQNHSGQPLETRATTGA